MFDQIDRNHGIKGLESVLDELVDRGKWRICSLKLGMTLLLGLRGPFHQFGFQEHRIRALTLRIRWKPFAAVGIQSRLS